MKNKAWRTEGCDIFLPYFALLFAYRFPEPYWALLDLAFDHGQTDKQTYYDLLGCFRSHLCKEITVNKYDKNK